MPSVTQSLSKIVLVGLTSCMLVLAGFLAPLAQAQNSSGGGRDCDDNAVLRCGAFSTQEVKQKYNSQAGAKTIFSHLGISSTEVNEMTGKAVNGYVTKGGRVMVGDKTVATDATTAGRQNIPGSKTVKKNGLTFYTRPQSLSFSEDKMEAYVVMKNNRFQYAVIKRCGNPVKATPVAQPKPQPQPTPPPVTPSPQPTPPPPVTTPPPTPTVSSAECRLLSITKRENRQVGITVSSRVSNAVVTGYTVDFGDGTASVQIPAGTTTGTTTTSNTTAQNHTSQTATHQYAQDGTYTIVGSVQVRHADGRTETRTGEACQQQITFTTPIVPAAKTESPAPAPAPPEPVAAQPLPATGAGEIMGISAAVGLVSMFGYALYGWLRSRFGLL